jgi:hypothetical protein
MGVSCVQTMPSQAIIVGIQTFVATLAFVAACLGLTKALVDAGFLKKPFQKSQQYRYSMFLSLVSDECLQ